MDNLYTSSPQVRVTFHPQIDTNLGRPIYLTINSKLTDSLVSVQTHKDTRTPAGHFSVTLAPHRIIDESGTGNHKYREVLRPGDLVVIEMGPDRPDPFLLNQKIAAANGYNGLEVVMVGSIDDVTETTSFNANDGKPERTLTVTGRDLGKYLVDDQIWWDSWSQPARALFGLAPEIDEWLRAKKDGGTAAGLVQLLLTRMAEHFDITFRFGDAKKKFTRRLFSDMLRYDLTLGSAKDPVPVIAAPLGLESYQGSPWALLERVASPPLYVLGIDTRRIADIGAIMDRQGAVLSNNNHNFIDSPWGKWESIPTVMLYRNPWSNRDYSDWETLPTRVVQDSDLMAREVSRSNAEISNTWRVWTDAQGAYRTQGGGDIAQARALRDYDSIQRYGERPLIINTPFISGQGQGKQQQLVKTYSFRLKDWNRWNEYFLSGKFVMKGMAAVKAGDRLWHWDREFGEDVKHGFTGGVDYYVEGVTQEFTSFTGWRTSVEVSRGQKHRNAGEELLYEDVLFTDTDLKSTDTPARQQLLKQAQQVWVWGSNS